MIEDGMNKQKAGLQQDHAEENVDPKEGMERELHRKRSDETN